MRLPLFALLFLFCLSFVAAEYSDPRDGFSVSDRVEVVDTAVYDTGFYSVDGSSWSQFSLQGESFGDWVLGEAQSEVVPDSARYFAVFSCSWVGSWDCSETWQVLDRGARDDGSSGGSYVPEDSLEGDFEALQALYASTQGQGLPSVSAEGELPNPRTAEYPWMYMVGSELYVLERGRDVSHAQGIDIDLGWVNRGAPWADKTGWDDMTPQTMGAATGVAVDQDGRVVELDFQKQTTVEHQGGLLTAGNVLAGVLPPELGNLRRVSKFNVKQNYLYGQIPPEIGFMRDLERLSLAGHHWELDAGRDARGTWWETSHLHTNYDGDPYSYSVQGKGHPSTNRFRTHLPEEIGDLEDLDLIEISQQYLLGSLPENWGNLRPRVLIMQRLFPISGGLKSEVPSSWSDMTSLWSFRITGFRGEEGPLIGELPVGMNEWDNIKNFAIQNNDLEGSVPVFSKSRDIVYFNIGGNSFSGEFPWLGFFNGNNTRISKFAISRNSFSGELPASIEPPSFPTQGEDGKYRLADFSIRENEFSGDVPEWTADWARLQIYSIARNNFTGSFPAALLSQERLKAFDLSENNLVGELPDGVWATDRAPSMWMEENNFEGEIPDSWQTAFQDDRGNWATEEARWVRMHDNQLSGPIPDWAIYMNWRSSGRTEYRFDNNRHTFRDIVPVYDSVQAVMGDGFIISPQKPFGPSPWGEQRVLEVSSGGSLVYDELSEYVSHVDNVYRWERDGSILSGQDDVVLSLSSVSSSDSGSYRLLVTNLNVPDLTLFSEEVELVVS